MKKQNAATGLATETPGRWRERFYQLVAPPPTQNKEPLPATRKAGRNLPAAIGVGLALVGLIALTLWLHKLAFLGLMSLAICVGLWELAGGVARVGVLLPLPPLWLGTFGTVASAYFYGPEAMFSAFVATVGLSVAWRLMSGATPSAIRDATVAVFAAAYLPLMAGFVALLISPPRGIWYVLIFVAIPVANDVGGYAVGVLFGRRPFAPSISPKKSVEGLLGSLAFAIAVAVPSVLALGGAWWLGVLLGVLGVVAATTGDLAESLIKRDIGLKDMAATLPGHGGIMDRLDSLLLTAPVCYLLLPMALGG
ncbi:MAG: phosphatidate cytidylyltransferase [Buchananella hordeovulneris]|nr:phosphatidate cytidylyltransferase [Buchananella hordeovulneris]